MVLGGHRIFVLSGFALTVGNFKSQRAVGVFVAPSN
jgi:hypothetical protein